jgi:hypothetical protein
VMEFVDNAIMVAIPAQWKPAWRTRCSGAASPSHSRSRSS